MITAELDKKDLVRLVYGIKPYYSLHEYLKENNFGTYCTDGNKDWQWNTIKIENMLEEKLWELYELCKNSLK